MLTFNACIMSVKKTYTRQSVKVIRYTIKKLYNTTFIHAHNMRKK